jgi:hypothetical protein
MKEVLFSLLLIWIFGMVIIDNYFTPDYNSTDNITVKERSGLILYTDHGTGLQYISGGLFGNITPRLDANGKHMNIKYIK